MKKEGAAVSTPLLRKNKKRHTHHQRASQAEQLRNFGGLLDGLDTLRRAWRRWRGGDIARRKRRRLQ